MSNKTKLTATTPRGVFTRTTERVYTHVVVATYSNGQQVVSWSSSLALAQKQEARFEKLYKGAASVEVFPCDWLVEMQAIDRGCQALLDSPEYKAEQK